ncbi:MAG: glycosyltransferase family 2 protein [Thermomicrobia bacterium]|nr:glycosyltransferase family 2 protein [Thermomicrobia bacterium]
MAAVPDISIVIVSRDTRELLRACLRSIGEQRDRYTVETIVVESDSHDGTAAMVHATFPEVILLEPGENTGFARGNNLGIARARGAAILLLNPDTELTAGALATLYRALDAEPAVGLVGPLLRYPDGTVQSSRRRFPTLVTALVESTLMQEWWPNHPALARYYCADRPDDVLQDVDWLVGACLLVRREVFTAVGLLDERLFLYGEEPEFCWRVRRAGWRVRYVPLAEVRHHEGASTGQNLAARQQAFAVSKTYLMGRLYGPVVGAVTRGALVLDQAVRLTREAAKWALGHKRALRAARVLAACATLRALLLPAGRGRE